MSTVIAKNVQIGTSGTATDNFTIFQPATPDGTLRIGNGNTGITTSQVALTSAGNVGIGTTAPTTRLSVVSATNSGISVNDGTVNTIIYNSTGGVSSFGTTTNHPIDFYTNNTARARIDTSGNLQFNSGYGSVATAYGCRAWVNFNGQGTIAIRASGNVSSITDLGTGLYRVNFSTAMPDTSYSVNANSTWNAGVTAATTVNINGDAGSVPTTSSYILRTFVSVDGSVFDPLFVYSSVFR